MVSLKRITIRALQCQFLWLVLVGVASAQSGRCVMEGFVVGQSDFPGVSGATVELIGDPDIERQAPVKLTAKAGEQGKYSLKEIPHGDYILLVSAPGYIPYRIELYMLSDTTTQLHVKLRKDPAPAQK